MDHTLVPIQGHISCVIYNFRSIGGQKPVVLIGVSALQIFGMVFACCLAKRARKWNTRNENHYWHQWSQSFQSDLCFVGLSHGGTGDKPLSLPLYFSQHLSFLCCNAVIRVAPNFSFGKSKIRPFFPNSASAKFLTQFGRRQCNCSAFS